MNRLWLWFVGYSVQKVFYRVMELWDCLDAARNKHTMNSQEIPVHVLAQWSNLAGSLKPKGYCITRHDEPIDETTYPTEEAAGEALDEGEGFGNGYGVQPVLECLTVGYSPESQSWGYQTGDNSFTGGAYGHPFWGVVWLSQDDDAKNVANDLAEQISEQMAS